MEYTAQVVVNSAIRRCAKGGAWATALALLKATEPDVISAESEVDLISCEEHRFYSILLAFKQLFHVFKHVLAMF